MGRRKKVVAKNCCICGNHIASAHFNPTPLPGDACCEYCFRAYVIPITILTLSGDDPIGTVREYRNPKRKD